MQKNSTYDNSDVNIKSFHDNSISETYYEIKEKNYTISISENSTLRAFSDTTFNYDLPTTTNKSIAKEFITNFYNNLEVPHNYELEYLEIFDDSMWEADFVKKVDNIYNYYDSIKIFFSPNQQKIAALRIHSSAYANAGIETVNETISETEVKNIVKNNFSNITDDNIINMELVYTKPNNFFSVQDGSDIISENNVIKSWKVTIEKNSMTTFVFVDFLTGNIIGGDKIK